MENKDFMIEEQEVMETEVETNEEKSGLSSATAMAIGAGLTLLGIAAVKGVKKLIAKRKAKKELNAGVIEGTCTDVTDEDSDSED